MKPAANLQFLEQPLEGGSKSESLFIDSCVKNGQLYKKLLSG